MSKLRFRLPALTITAVLIGVRSIPAQASYPDRINQPRLRDPSTHGGIPGSTGTGDISIDGHVAILSRRQVDPATLEATTALVAVAVDPLRIQKTPLGHLDEFQDLVHPNPPGIPLFYGENMTFSSYENAFVIEELPSPDDYQVTPPIPPGGNLQKLDGFNPIAITLKRLSPSQGTHGMNPYPCDATGAFDEASPFRRYEFWMIAAHYPWVWNPSPPGAWQETSPQLGARDVTVILDPTASPPVVIEATASQSTPLSSLSFGDLLGHEPTITADGQLILYHSGGSGNQPADSDLWGVTTYIWNPSPYATTGWSDPASVTDMYWVESDEGGPNYAPTTVGTASGETVFFRDLYPLAQFPIREPDGTMYGYGMELRGPYPWVDREGRFFVATHTFTEEAGSSAATRAGMYAVGSLTQGYLKHIDDPALNPTRAGGAVEWPVDGLGSWIGRDSNRLIVTSTGLKPGPWEMFMGDDVPVPSQSAGRRVPVLPLFSLTGDQYGEVRFEEVDGDYILYLACNEGFRPHSVFGNQNAWEADPTTTPDTSGREPRSTCLLQPGAFFPQEYAGSAAALRDVTGTGQGTGHENLGFKGQALLFAPGGYVLATGSTAISRKLTVQAFIKVLPGWESSAELTILQDVGRFRLSLDAAGEVHAEVTLPGHVTGAISTTSGVGGYFEAELDPYDPTEGWRHVAMQYDGAANDGTASTLKILVDGTVVREASVQAPSELIAPVPGGPFLLIGPSISGGSSSTEDAVMLLDEVAVSRVIRTPEELARDAYISPSAPSAFAPWPTELELPYGLDKEDAYWPADITYSADKVQLGGALFTASILSGDTSTAPPSWGGVTCATCHVPTMGFAHPAQLAPSTLCGTLPFNAPTLLNATFGTRKFFDGRAEFLEEQPGFTIPGECEMNAPMNEVVSRLNDVSNLGP